jgi:hypothetical protein
MTYEEFTPLFTMLVEEKKKQDNFIRCLPNSIAEAFFDNEYVEALERQTDFLLNALFEDKDLLEDVYNLMYGAFFGMSDEDPVLETLEGKLAYLKTNYFSEV